MDEQETREDLLQELRVVRERLKDREEQLTANIAGRKRSEEALRETEILFRSLFDTAAVGLAVVDLTDHVLAANEACCRFLGCSPEELRGMHFSRFTYPDDLGVDRELHESLVRGERESYMIEKRYVRKDDRIAWGRLHVSLIRSDDGQPHCTVVVCEDITERRRMKEELFKTQKLESLGVLAGGIAHDFNNLLTAILGNISLARMFLNKPEKVHERLEEAEKACLRIQDLTLQLLTFSRGGEPVKKAIAPAGVIREAASFALRGSNVRCECVIPDDLWPIDADEGQISQAVNNIIINAVQAMPQGGTIDLQCENTFVRSADPVPLTEGRYLKISIRDRGTGIPAEHLPRIYDPFFTTKQRGSGLGLATVYSIVKKHDGHISVESVLGKGTTVALYLPASRHEITAEQVPGEKPRMGKGRLLIMDDEEIIRDIAGRILTTAGYDVELAQDGYEAVARYAAARDEGRPYHAIIMDLTVPGGMGGREAIAKLRAIDPRVKAIVSSGYSNDPVLGRYREYGFSGCVSKPYRVLELTQEVYRVIHESEGNVPEASSP